MVGKTLDCSLFDNDILICIYKINQYCYGLFRNIIISIMVLIAIGGVLIFSFV